LSTSIRRFETPDLDRVLDIAVAAWSPVFESFENLLGPDLFPTVYPNWQADKKKQVTSACTGDHPVDVWIAEQDDLAIGFITVYLNRERRVGVIGNNAVHPDSQGQGVGTSLYEFALQQMRDAGMEAAEVGTGGDPSHAPARRAYEKAGFDRAIPGVTYYQDLRITRNEQPGGGTR
jgi:GNAT superfamily N-acetyltransferase